jgi:hypothetical protein
VRFLGITKPIGAHACRQCQPSAVETHPQVGRRNVELTANLFGTQFVHHAQDKNVRLSGWQMAEAVMQSGPQFAFFD